jgi:N-acetylglucosaminyldiphosphoundecaprenol N-acetyl-beta-D-mannosaminyltransferase
MKEKKICFNIFGLDINHGSKESISTQILEEAGSSNRTLVVTPNSDHFLRWQKYSHFRELYDLASYRVIDGAPLLWIARILGARNIFRITGVDLTVKLLEEIRSREIGLAIIGGTAESMNSAIRNISAKYPGVNVYHAATPTSSELKSIEYLEQLSLDLEKERNKIVLICLGSPKQEEFFAFMESHTEGTGVYLCVGGTVDFLSEKKRRAPILIQKLGLEWFYRFVQEPNRLFHRYFIVDYKIFFYILKAIQRRIQNLSLN